MKQIEAMKQVLETLDTYGLHNEEEICPVCEAMFLLRESIEQVEKAEPVAEVVDAGGICHFPKLQWKSANHSLETPIGSQLFTHPPQQPEGWIRAVDEAMVCSHLGVAEASDSYEVAKKKLNDLICWNIQVATDPAVNGGWQLVPVDYNYAMKQAWIEGNSFAESYSALLAAAPKEKS